MSVPGVAMAVCDGHGTLGATAAQAACDYFEAFASRPFTRSRVEHIQEELVDAFAGAHDAVRRAMRVEAEKQGQRTRIDEDGVLLACTEDTKPWSPVRGGTTCTLAVRVESDRWVVAHVGDSPALWLPAAGGGLPRMVCHDHSPDSEEEARQLRQRASRPGLQLLYDSTVLGGQHPLYAPDGSKLAPQQGYYLKNVRREPATLCSTPIETPHVCHLAMLRCLGDFLLHPWGVTHCPSIVDVRGQGRLALFTDGITDVFTDEELAALAGAPAATLQEVARDVLAAATTQAQQVFGSTMDDRTVVLADDTLA